MEASRHLYTPSQWAAMLVNRAVRQGELERPSHCEECREYCLKDKYGRTGIQAHHDDYSKPLEVRWLCRSCHGRWHGIHGPGKGDPDLLLKKRALRIALN